MWTESIAPLLTQYVHHIPLEQIEQLVSKFIVLIAVIHSYLVYIECTARAVSN